MDASGFLDCLRRRTSIEAPVVIVVAHPDDETIGMGASLHLMRDLTVLHVTDGAPRNLRDVRAAGYENPKQYAAARRSEMQCALHVADASPRLIALKVLDQQAVQRLPEIVDTLRDVLAAAALVITHAYEGGHPDHDACALAVHLACATLDHPPAMLEFPAYHGADGDWAVQLRQRRKLRMNRHRADRAGGWAVRFATDAGPLDSLLRLHAQRWNGLDAAASRFHRTVAPHLLAVGLLRLARLDIDGEPAAFCHALADRQDRLMFYMIGFDPRFEALSPGSLLIAGMIDAAIAEGRREIHFLRGDEAYKYAWGARDRMNAACRLEI